MPPSRTIFVPGIIRWIIGGVTPEQGEQWKSAIKPLDYLDFHALSEAGLREARSQLASLAVPAWAVQLRAELIEQGWRRKESWVPDFALRSEVALVGLGVMHPYYTQAALAYERVFVRFIAEALRPIIEQAQKGNRRRRNGYRSVIKLCQLCERFETMGSALVWPKYLAPLPTRVIDDLLFRYSYVWKAYYNNLEKREAYWARSLSESLLGAITSIRNTGVPEHGGMSDIWAVKDILDELSRHYTLSRDTSIEGPVYYTDVMARAYQVALDAECPPPDWLAEWPKVERD